MKRLFAYFTWSNNTKKIVEGLEKEVSADVIRIERKIPYSTDYDTCAYVEAKEEWEKHIHPEIKPLNVNFDDYDEIDLFFPIWWYTFPMVVGTFAKELKNYKGRVVVFANSYTNDYKYMETSLKGLREINSNINFVEGLFNKNIKEHISFLKGE